MVHVICPSSIAIINYEVLSNKDEGKEGFIILTTEVARYIIISPVATLHLFRLKERR